MKEQNNTICKLKNALIYIHIYHFWNVIVILEVANLLFLYPTFLIIEYSKVLRNAYKYIKLVPKCNFQKSKGFAMQLYKMIVRNSWGPACNLLLTCSLFPPKPPPHITLHSVALHFAANIQLLISLSLRHTHIHGHTIAQTAMNELDFKQDRGRQTALRLS